jgi:hypothetical protein
MPDPSYLKKHKVDLKKECEGGKCPKPVKKLMEYKKRPSKPPKQDCPPGKYWDSTLKKCVTVKESEGTHQNPRILGSESYVKGRREYNVKDEE